MSTLTITLPEEIKLFVEKQSAAQGYESVSAYIDDMLRTLLGMNGLTLEDIKEMQPDSEFVANLQRPDVLAELEKKLLDGLNSPGKIVDAAFWESRREALREKYPHVDFNADD